MVPSLKHLVKNPLCPLADETAALKRSLKQATSKLNAIQMEVNDARAATKQARAECARLAVFEPEVKSLREAVGKWKPVAEVAQAQVEDLKQSEEELRDRLEELGSGLGVSTEGEREREKRERGETAEEKLQLEPEQPQPAP